MSTIAQTLNEYLRFFDWDDPVFKSLVSNPAGVPEPTITNPMHFNIGYMANLLEWNRKLVLKLLTQLDLTQAESQYLDLIAHKHLGITRYSGETNAEFVARIQVFVIAHKVSPASIIYHTKQFSSPGDPVLLEGPLDSAFADVTFTDNYQTFQNQAPGDDYLWWVQPAITVGADGGLFFFILILQNTPDADIPKVIDLVDRLIAAGVNYQIQIET